MKFGQVIKHTKGNIFLKHHAWGRETSSIWTETNSIRFCKKGLFQVKASGVQFSFNIFQ